MYMRKTHLLVKKAGGNVRARPILVALVHIRGLLTMQTIDSDNNNILRVVWSIFLSHHRSPLIIHVCPSFLFPRALPAHLAADTKWVLQGVLFFELFYPVMSASERLHTLSGLRHRILPMSLLQGRPQEAAFVISLLHPDPSARPTAAQLMRHECLSALQCSICRDPVRPCSQLGSAAGMHRLCEQHVSLVCL